ncbi:hypothetical protein PAXRUDRAFT_519723 [Paxillus rubicundulus Ve08.2h10]|uniref:Uncharacterized protein n=1 Tax=Paxillus rubicundulus Ve08.2h10 TaxID=930991 RepID=A0A0D0E6J2_9AGAM|nr:hypothetical protein PAXRUDRAFT_519723 [Paxillus rubicundulus Ve08.2h10]
MTESSGMSAQIFADRMVHLFDPPVKLDKADVDRVFLLQFLGPTAPTLVPDHHDMSNWRSFFRSCARRPCRIHPDKFHTKTLLGLPLLEASHMASRYSSVLNQNI